MSYLVEVNGLNKSYSGFRALNDFNFNVAPGRIVGLLGPNGSGKTTFIKILSGLLTFDTGSVLIDGKRPGCETKSLVSYLPERPYFNSWMRVDECLDYFEEFYEDFDRVIAERMLFDLNVPTDSKLKTLSKGTKEKVQLILVMARRAKLYLLDEPIAGVDPAARDYILETIISSYNREASIIISTHLIADVESVLDDFAFISNGHVVLGGSANDLRREKNMSIDEYFREVFRCYRSC